MSATVIGSKSDLSRRSNTTPGPRQRSSGISSMVQGGDGGEFNQLAMPSGDGREVEASEFNKGATVVPRAPALVVARVSKGGMTVCPFCGAAGGSSYDTG